MMYAGTLSVDPPSAVVSAAYLRLLWFSLNGCWPETMTSGFLIGDINDGPIYGRI